MNRNCWKGGNLSSEELPGEGWRSQALCGCGQQAVFKKLHGLSWEAAAWHLPLCGQHHPYTCRLPCPPNFPWSPARPNPWKQARCPISQVSSLSAWRWDPQPVKQDHSTRFSAVPALRFLPPSLGGFVLPPAIASTKLLSFCTGLLWLLFLLHVRERQAQEGCLGTPRPETHQTPAAIVTTTFS